MPTHGRGCASITRSPKACKQSITTQSANENANGTIFGAGQPLKNVPVQQFSDSCPNPIQIQQ